MDHLPGFREFYPAPLPANELWSADARQYLFSAWRRVARRYGFREYDGPPLEPLELYTAKSGDEIVGQLFNFVDKGERAVSLRPEMTPTLARMIAKQERSYKKPIKWFAIPQLFRYEKQQKGRLREHFQLNADIFGEAGSEADAEIIALLIDVLRTLGLGADDFCVRLSSRAAWQQFFERSCQDLSRAAGFFQAIDKMEREDPAVTNQRLMESGSSLEAVKAFIDSAEPTPDLRVILDNLDSRGLGAFVKIDYMVIRGLAYYTGPVFEAFDRKGVFRAIAGGGRYDQLVKQLSGGKADLPGLGFGMGDVVLMELLKDRKLLPNFLAAWDAFLVIESESERPVHLRFLQELRDAGLSVEYPLTPSKSDKQMKRAVELGCGCTVRLEAGDPGKARCRNLATREEAVVARAEAPDWIRALSRGNGEAPMTRKLDS